MLPVENYRLSRLIHQERIQPALAPQRAPRRPALPRTPRLLRLLEQGRIDPTPMTTHRFPFAHVERAFHMMETKEDNIIKPLITY